jgi:Ca-activated chloride channel family protein
MSLTFDQPLLLGLLPVSLGLVYVLWRKSRVYLPLLRRQLALGLRALGITLLVLVLSGPKLQLNASDLAIAVLLDRSDSISPAQRAQEEAWLAAMLAHKSARDQVAVVGFAGDATLERPLSADPSPPVLSEDSTLQGSRTDIAAAIRLGLGVLPPDAARRLVLVSDGNENAEESQQAAALARTRACPSIRSR